MTVGGSLFSLGCGGRVVESPASNDSGSVSVSAQFSIGGSGTAVSAAKDASGSGGLTGGGMVETIVDSLTVSCAWTGIPDELYAGGCPIIKGENVTYADDCIGADLGAFDSNCCLVARMATDPETGKCDLAIEGVVPGNNATIAGITLTPVGHIQVSIASDGATDATSMALLQHADLVGTDDLSFPQDVVDLEAAMDVSACDGSDGSMTIDFADAMGVGVYDAFLGDSFEKAYGFSAYGDGTCDFDQMYAFELSLADTRDNWDVIISPFDLTVNFTLCDEKAGGLCVLAGSGGQMDAGSGDFNMLVDGLLENITDGTTDVRTPLVLWFDESMLLSSMNSSSVIITAETPDATQPSYTIEENGTLQDGFSYNVKFADLTPSYLYQNQDMRAVISDAVLSESNKRASPVTVHFGLGGAVSDGFTSDTSDNYSYDEVVINDVLPPTEDQSAEAAPYLNFGDSGWKNRCWALSDAAKSFPDVHATIAPTKQVIPQVQSTIEIAVNDIAHFDHRARGNVMEADLVGLRIADATSGKFLFLGVQAMTAYDGEVRSVCVAGVYDPAFGGYVSGSYRDCEDVVNANFRLEYDQWSETLVAYMSEDPGAPGSVFERMDGANYNALSELMGKSLSMTDLPKSPDGMSSVGLIFNSSAGNERSLRANVLKIEAFGWKSEALSWETLQPSVAIDCGTPDNPCM
jgi:hypothetical protein